MGALTVMKRLASLVSSSWSSESSSSKEAKQAGSETSSMPWRLPERFKNDLHAKLRTWKDLRAKDAADLKIRHCPPKFADSFDRKERERYTHVFAEDMLPKKSDWYNGWMTDGFVGSLLDKHDRLSARRVYEP